MCFDFGFVGRMCDMLCICNFYGLGVPEQGLDGIPRFWDVLQKIIKPSEHSYSS